MKREIKFKAKRIFDNAWIEGSLVVDKKGEMHILQFNEIEEDGHHLVINSDLPMFFHQDTFCQYTGFGCKNGDIYDGDLLKLSSVLWKVFFNTKTKSFWAVVIKGDNGGVGIVLPLYEFCLQDFMITGNIHD